MQTVAQKAYLILKKIFIVFIYKSIRCSIDNLMVEFFIVLF